MDMVLEPMDIGLDMVATLTWDKKLLTIHNHNRIGIHPEFSVTQYSKTSNRKLFSTSCSPSKSVTNISVQPSLRVCREFVRIINA